MLYGFSVILVEMCGCNKKKAEVQSTSTGRSVPSPSTGRSVPSPPTGRPSAPVPERIPTVDTSVWGASLWKALHIAAHHTKYKAQMLIWKNLLRSLRESLPCPECTSHFIAWHASHELRFSMFPGTFHNTAIAWVADLHNDVNKRLGLPTWNLQQLNAAYGGNRAVKLAEGRASLQKLHGVIGRSAYDFLLSLLQ